MPESVVFKKGLLAQLESTPVSNGQLLITTDERAIYFDTDGDRIRLGDFIEVANIAALPKEGANASALYYVKASNVLAKWDETESKWIHINEDTGATAATVDGTGATASGITASYDADSRTIKITVAKNLIDDTTLTGKIGDIKKDTIKEYVDEQISLVNPSESGLANKVQQLETKVGTIQGTGEGSITKAVGDAKTELIGQDDDLATADTIKGAKKAVEDAKTELLGTGTTSDDTIKGAKKYADEQIAAKLGSAYKVSGSVDDLASLSDPAKELVGNVYNVKAAFTTDAKFLEGAGKSYPAGTNVVVIEDDGDYKFDVLSGVVDLTNYAKKTEVEQAKKDLQGTSTNGVVTTSIGAAADDVLGKTDEKITAALTWGSFGEA